VTCKTEVAHQQKEECPFCQCAGITEVSNPNTAVRTDSKMNIIPEIRKLIEEHYELGMLQFGTEVAAPDGLTAIGMAESDPLCVRNDTGEVIVLDHEVTGRVLCKAALSQESLIQTFPILEKHFQRNVSDEEYWNNETAALNIRMKCTEIAGGDDYASFFCSLIGV
jgi:hypothetical protein